MAPTSLSIDSGGVALQVYDYGDQAATPLVLVHGIEDFALSLDSLAEELSTELRVISYDLRGHGDSDKPGVYTFPHHLADLHALILQLGLERPVLAGHSLGGQIVTHYAAIFTEVPSKVVSIEGLGPPFRDIDLPLDVKQWRTRSAIESLLQPGAPRRPMADIEDAIQLFGRYHPRITHEDARRIVELGTESHPHGGLQWKWDPLVHTTWLSGSHQQSAERWGWIECPVLLITAGQAHEFWHRSRGIDAESARIEPEELERRIGHFREAVHVEIDDAGHMVHYDAPQALLAEMKKFFDL